MKRFSLRELLLVSTAVAVALGAYRAGRTRGFDAGYDEACIWDTAIDGTDIRLQPISGDNLSFVYVIIGADHWTLVRNLRICANRPLVATTWDEQLAEAWP